MDNEPETSDQYERVVIVVVVFSRPGPGKNKYAFKRAEQFSIYHNVYPQARAYVCVCAGNMRFFPTVFAFPSPSNGTRRPIIVHRRSSSLSSSFIMWYIIT